MAKTTVQCTAYGTLYPGVPEVAALLANNAPSSLPSQAEVDAVLSNIPTAEGLARLAFNRWSRTNAVSAHGPILDAFIKLHASEASTALKPPAQAFLEAVRTRLVTLVQDSLSKFGAVEGPVYDEVYGEGADKSTIPAYLPVVSHFQLHFHDIPNDRKLQAEWDSCLQACGVSLGTTEAGLGTSPSRRALAYLLSMSEDVAFLRLVQVLLHASHEFKFD